jgi:diguanylate cyclase (GGDEF)-like protein/PAS domain S-box-containing protein
MKKYNFSFIYIKIILLLLLFAMIVVAINTYQIYNFRYINLNHQLQTDANRASEHIKQSITRYLNTVEKSIDAMAKSPLFHHYLNEASDEHRIIVENLFKSAMLYNRHIVQFRYIGIDGFEKIRINRTDQEQLMAVAKANLQNKKERYYFKETLASPNEGFWYSKIDLNQENGTLQYPLRPTYRIGSPILWNKRVMGMLIVNINMQALLESIAQNDAFELYLFDRDGYIIIAPDKQHHWSRYLNTPYNIYDSYPKLRDRSIDQHLGYLYSLESYFNNGEDIHLFLRVNEDYISDLRTSNIDYFSHLLLLLLLSTAVVGIFVAFVIYNILKKFSKIQHENLKYISTIDKYVITMTTDTRHKITYASEALCNVTGYTKKELIGAQASIFRSGKMHSEHYKSIKETIHNGYVWVGELQNKTKSGEIYWLNSTMVPNFDAQGKIISFTAMSENITDKKRIEQISQTDKLTQLYNRVKLDDTLKVLMNRYQRYDKIFSLILIDIDFFKRVNDTYGHNVGDSVLIELSNLLLKHSKEKDIVGRWGGEEFLIICKDRDITQASEFAQLLRKNIEACTFRVIKHQTVSIGVTETIDNDNIETLIKRADENLYEAKASGRNRVIAR